MSDSQDNKQQYKDTREQMIAQTYDRNISVTANAGAGKTSVLQKRFVKLLLENEDLLPKEIVAITFTRNAASEIRSRITEAFDKILRQKPLSYTRKKRLYFLRERLQSAQISTIHSFCSSLIRDYPIESGVVSNFSELSNAESLKIENDAITKVLTNLLNKNENDEINILLDAFGRYELEKIIHKILNNRYVFYEIAKLYNKKGDDILLEKAEDYFYSLYFDQIKFFYDSFIDLLEELSNIIDDNNFLPFLIDNIADLKDINFDENKNANLEIILLKINNIIEELRGIGLINKSSLSFSKRKFKKSYKETVNELNFQLKEFDSISTIVDSIKNKYLHADLIATNRLLINLVSLIIKEIDLAKEKIVGLDFDDLLIKTNNMLNDEIVAEKIRKRYKFLMVDEFQDTNKVQYDIVRKLLPELDNGGKTQINLFIVGDAKQSIYGFRNADVRVFKKATQDIINSNRKLINQKQLEKDFYNGNIISKNNEAFGEIELSISFRHKPVIAAFVNKIFNNLDLQNQFVSEFNVKYNNFICSQNIEDLRKYTENQDNRNSNIGKCEFLITIKPKDDDDFISENENIARYILKLVNVDKYNFSDIAILSRAKTKFKGLIDVFQKYNIPYLLNSGKDFFRTQEILDIISFLKFINNRNDDLALAAILRSGFFDLNDTELYLISMIKNKSNLYSKLKYFVENNGNGKINTKIMRAYDIIKEISGLNSGVTISRLVLAIIDKCKWFGTFVNKSSVHQIKANVNKFISYTRSFEEKGFKNLSDFLEEIELINKEKIDESEALFVSNENLVNVMSIHAAKGLEFPVVILYNTNSNNPNKESFFIDEEIGFGYKIPIYDKAKKFFIEQETPLFNAIKFKNSLKESEEEKRILYVALTRAKERLVVSATFKETNSGISGFSGLFKIICKGLNIDNSELFLNSESLNIEEKLSLYENDKISDITFTFPLSIIKNVNDYETVHNEYFENNIPKKLFIQGIDSKEMNLKFSATRFMIYKQNFDDYLKSYVLRINKNDELQDLKIGQANDLKNIPARDIGTIIHITLENINLWLNQEKKVNDNKLEEIIESISKRFAGKVQDSLIIEIKEKVLKVISTNLIDKNIDNLLKSKKELSLTIPIADDFLEVILDLLIKRDGQLEIWDWKTNNITYSKMKDTANHYALQMQLYAYVILLLYPELNFIRTRLLFTNLADENKKDEEWTYCFKFHRKNLDFYESNLITMITELKELN